MFMLAPASATDVQFKRLLQAQSLKCTFGEGSIGLWEAGSLEIDSDNFGGVNFFYNSIDARRGTARVIANMGASDVSVEAGAYGLTFIERALSAVTITTAFAHYKQGTTEFIAVLSRHVAFMGPPMPSQCHGTCVIWQ
jgi:hypothetical protein